MCITQTTLRKSCSGTGDYHDYAAKLVQRASSPKGRPTCSEVISVEKKHLMALHIDDDNDATGKKMTVIPTSSKSTILFVQSISRSDNVFFELLTQMKRIHTLLLSFFLFAQTKSSRNFRMSGKLHQLLLT